ncbi:MAG: hypothetical protein HWE10_14640 [Gammaproteobacteria bacterium]|nr:hypothetical protein [Gammaproteobacteria bacterium]
MLFALDKWSESLLKTQHAIGKQEFFANLAMLLSHICRFDEILIVEFTNQGITKKLFQKTSNSDSNLTLYLTKMFVLDPFYVSGKKGIEGLLMLDKLTEGLNEAYDDYRLQYFKHLNFGEEIGYLIQLPNATGCIHIELAQLSHSSGFKEKEIHQLESVFKTVKTLVLKHIEKITPRGFEMETSYVEDFHQLFGSAVLTPREYDVSLLMLQGYSVKSIASHLSLGDETVKMHRKNIYGKLSVNSQPELMALFIDLLVMAEPPVKVDPLVAYLDKKSQCLAFK